MQVERIPLPSRQWAEALVLPEAPHAAMHTVQYHVVVVPGNPGVASFYEPFATALHARLQGSMSVRCVNLAGFAPVRDPADAASTAGAVAPATAACAHGCAHGHSHSHSHRPARDPPADRLFSLVEQCNYLHEYLRALQLQLQCADELARSASTPPSAGSVAAKAAQLLSPHLRPGSSTLPPTPTPRQHRFVLVCHSIGAYLGLATLARARVEQRRWAGRPLEPQLPGSALDDLAAYLSSPAAQPSLPQRRPPVHVAHAFLLFPFVRMDLGWLQFHATRTVLAWRWLPRLMARLGRLVPVALYRLVLRLAMRITSEHAVRAVVALARSRALIEQSSFFAHTEFRDVLPPAPAASTAITAPSGPVDPARAALIPGGGGSSGAVATFDNSFLGAHVSSTTLYYAGKEHDCWGPQSQMRDFQQQIPGLDARLVPSVTHAWCAYTDQSATMAELVSRDLDALQLRWIEQGSDSTATDAAAPPPESPAPQLPSSAAASPPAALAITSRL